MFCPFQVVKCCIDISTIDINVYITLFLRRGKKIVSKLLMSSCCRGSVRLWLSKQMVRKPHELCWQLSAVQSILILPLLITHPMCWTTRRSKEKQQMPHSFWYPEPSTGLSPVLVMLFWGEWILVDSAFLIGGLQVPSKQYQKTSAAAQPTPEDSTSLFVCLCWHSRTGMCLPLLYIWLNRMNGILVVHHSAGASSWQADR